MFNIEPFTKANFSISLLRDLIQTFNHVSSAKVSTLVVADHQSPQKRNSSNIKRALDANILLNYIFFHDAFNKSYDPNKKISFKALEQKIKQDYLEKQSITSDTASEPKDAKELNRRVVNLNVLAKTAFSHISAKTAYARTVSVFNLLAKSKLITIIKDDYGHFEFEITDKLIALYRNNDGHFFEMPKELSKQLEKLKVGSEFLIYLLVYKISRESMYSTISQDFDDHKDLYFIQCFNKKDFDLAKAEAFINQRIEDLKLKEKYVILHKRAIKKALIEFGISASNVSAYYNRAVKFFEQGFTSLTEPYKIIMQYVCMELFEKVKNAPSKVLCYISSLFKRFTKGEYKSLKHKKSLKEQEKKTQIKEASQDLNKAYSDELCIDINGVTVKASELTSEQREQLSNQANDELKAIFQ